MSLGVLWAVQGINLVNSAFKNSKSSNQSACQITANVEKFGVQFQVRTFFISPPSLSVVDLIMKSLSRFLGYGYLLKI